MALIINPNDPQNIFYKANKITNEIYLIFAHNEKILNCKMGKQVKSQLQVIPIPEALDKQLVTISIKNIIIIFKQQQRPYGNYKNSDMMSNLPITIKTNIQLIRQVEHQLYHLQRQFYRSQRFKQNYSKYQKNIQSYQF